MTADYRCEKCECVWEYRKPEIGMDYPQNKELNCPKCGSKETKRVWGSFTLSIGGIDAQTGIYMSSPLTPHHKQPGGVHNWDLTDY